MKKNRLKNQSRNYTWVAIICFIFSSELLMSQDVITVTGVVSSNKDPLIGAVVQQKNTQNASITNTDGMYSISVAKGSSLKISYLGHKTKEIIVKNTICDIELEEERNLLDEVVAIGYGVQQKKLLTGATTQVKGDQLAKQNAINPFGALQGLTPGVGIVKNNGKPGEGFKITIRGAGTMHDAAPLCVIDGLAGGNINSINPSDIESIDILKDAASAAIYGARAANGVILVTTKQGQKGRVNISYDGYYGWQNIKNNVSTLNANDYIMMTKEAGLLTDGDINSSKIPMLDKIKSGDWKGTNWLDEMIQPNAPIQNHSININKGTESSAFSLGFSYTGQKPTIAAPSKEVEAIYERYTARLNSEHSLIKLSNRDLLTVGETMLFSYSNRRGLDQATGQTSWNDIRNAFKTSPLFPAYEEDGSFGKPVTINPQEFNPIAKMHYNSSMKDSKNYEMRGNIYLILEPVKNLKWRSSFGIDYSSWSYRGYIPAYNLNGSNEVKERNTVSQQGGMGLKWQLENTISYQIKVNESHHINALIGNTVEKSGLGDNFSGSNEGVEYDDFFHAYLENAKTIEKGRTTVSGSAWGESSLVSFFGRFNYDYQNKYMFTLVVRGDGSSNFARGHRWGFFPSISAGWNITEEEFMMPAKQVLDHLKIRASWGENGNNRIPAFRYLPTMELATNANGAYYYFGDKTGSSSDVGSFISYLPNNDLTWETSQQTNIGLDAMMFGNRLGINFDWYYKKTMDWLVQGTPLGIWGTGAPWVNGGDIVNQGVELQINWNHSVNDFKYSISGNIGYNSNEVVRIANQESYIDGKDNILGSGTGVFYRAEVGKPLGYFLGYRTNGIFQNQAEVDSYVKPGTDQKIMPNAKPGDVRFVDTDGNGTITTDDRSMLGDPNPKFNYGASISFEYKAFDLSVTGYGVSGNQIVKSYRVNSVLNTSNYTSDMLNRWHGEGTSNRLPSLNGSIANWQNVSDLYIENGDFFRISNITVGMDIRKFLKVCPLQQIRFYVSGQNLFTFTQYSGLDPEVSAYTGAQSWARGIDLGNYPIAYSFLVGLSIRY